MPRATLIIALAGFVCAGWKSSVEDSGAFIAPWSVAQRWRRKENRPLAEDVCAENNFSYFGYDVAPLPQADTPDF
jgi:hypothetical protein